MQRCDMARLITRRARVRDCVRTLVVFCPVSSLESPSNGVPGAMSQVPSLGSGGRGTIRLRPRARHGASRDGRGGHDLVCKQCGRGPGRGSADFFGFAFCRTSTRPNVNVQTRISETAMGLSPSFLLSSAFCAGSRSVREMRTYVASLLTARPCEACARGLACRPRVK